MWNLSNVVIPPYAKYVAIALVGVALWGHGYVKGLESGYKELVLDQVTIIEKQGKVTEKIITKYITKYQKQNKIDTEIINEGTSFAIKFPDAGVVNDDFVRLFNASVEGELPSLSSGESNNTP